MKHLLDSVRHLRPIPAALLLAATLAAPLAQAQTAAAAAASQPHRGAGMHQGRMLQSIGATASQQSQIEAIMKQAHEDVRQQHQASGNLHQQLAQVLAAPTVDTAAAESIRQKILAQQDSTGQRMLQARLQVAAVLTPDQRQKLLALNQAQRDKRQGRHQAPTGT